MIKHDGTYENESYLENYIMLAELKQKRFKTLKHALDTLNTYGLKFGLWVLGAVGVECGPRLFSFFFTTLSNVTASRYTCESSSLYVLALLNIRRRSATIAWCAIYYPKQVRQM